MFAEMQQAAGSLSQAELDKILLSGALAITSSFLTLSATWLWERRARRRLNDDLKSELDQVNYWAAWMKTCSDYTHSSEIEALKQIAQISMIRSARRVELLFPSDIDPRDAEYIRRRNRLPKIRQALFLYASPNKNYSSHRLRFYIALALLLLAIITFIWLVPSHGGINFGSFIDDFLILLILTESPVALLRWKHVRQLEEEHATQSPVARI